MNTQHLMRESGRRRSLMRRARVAGFLVLVSLGSIASYADLVTFEGLGPGIGDNGLSASAMFEIVADELVVTLTNTSTEDVEIPVEVLTGLFFSIEGDPTLTPISAILGDGATVLFAPATDVGGDAIVGGAYAGGDVGAEWAYASGLSGPNGADQGIGSAGYGLFGPGDRFDTSGNLQGPASPNGLQYGITSDGDDAGTGNTPVTGANALIQDSVTFTLGGLPEDFTLDDIHDVSFQYGTGLSEPNLSVIPEPATAALLGMGLVGLFLRRRSGRHKN